MALGEASWLGQFFKENNRAGHRHLISRAIPDVVLRCGSGFYALVGSGERVLDWPQDEH